MHPKADDFCSRKQENECEKYTHTHIYICCKKDGQPPPWTGTKLDAGGIVEEGTDVFRESKLDDHPFKYITYNTIEEVNDFL